MHKITRQIRLSAFCQSSQSVFTLDTIYLPSANADLPLEGTLRLHRMKIKK